MEKTGGTAGDFSHELNTGDDRIEIVVTTLIAFVKVFKIDVGRIARVRPSGWSGRIAWSEKHATRGIMRVGLQNNPSEEILFAALLRIPGMIPREVARDREQEKIGIRLPEI